MKLIVILLFSNYAVLKLQSRSTSYNPSGFGSNSFVMIVAITCSIPFFASFPSPSIHPCTAPKSCIVARMDSNQKVKQTEQVNDKSKNVTLLQIWAKIITLFLSPPTTKQSAIISTSRASQPTEDKLPSASYAYGSTAAPPPSTTLHRIR